MYSTSFAGFKINDDFETFMSNWRHNSVTTSGHRNNIDYGEISGFMAAWIQKVVKCSDIPDHSKSGYYIDEP